MIEFSDYPDSGKLRGATEILLVTVSDPGLMDAKILFPGASAPSAKRYGYAFTGMRLTDGAKAYAIKISGTYVLLGGSVSGGGGGGDGVTFYPSVSSEGVISWTNDGGLPNPEPVNIKGPPGPSGFPNVWFGTLEEYNDLPEHDPAYVYFLEEPS